MKADRTNILKFCASARAEALAFKKQLQAEQQESRRQAEASERLADNLNGIAYYCEYVIEDLLRAGYKVE